MLPAPELVIFGAGHDAAPVAQLAWTLGFAVTVVDVRETFLTPDRFPGATLMCAHLSQFADQVHAAGRRFVLVMNHHVERDQESLRFALESDAAYIGVLGPRARYEKLLAGLAAQGYGPTPPRSRGCTARSGCRSAPRRRTRSRVAILGEMLAVRRGFEGGSLSGTTAQPSPSRGHARLGQLVIVRRVDVDQQVGGNRRTSVRSTCRCSTERAPCCSAASSGKNSRSNRCGGAMTSP